MMSDFQSIAYYRERAKYVKRHRDELNNHNRDMKLMTLAERMVWARQKMRLTQEELAKKAGVAQSTIAGLETSYRQNPRRLPQIAKALEIDPMWLAEGKGDPYRLNGNSQAPSVVSLPERLTPTLGELLSVAKTLGKEAQRELLGMAKGLAATERQSKANPAKS